MKKIFFVFVAMLISCHQESNVNLVQLISNSDVEFFSNGKWEKVIRYKTTIPKNTKIRVAKNSEAWFYPVSDRSFSPVKFEDGIHDLSDAYFPPQGSASSKILKLFAESHNDHAKQNYARGGASKGSLDIDFPMLFPADSELVIYRDFNFQWRKDSRSTYYFLLKQAGVGNDWICMNENINDTVLNAGNVSVCPQIKKLSPGVTYRWTVAKPSGSNSSGFYLDFAFADDKTIDKVKHEISTIESEGSKFNQEPEITGIIKAKYFEQQKMFFEAYKLLQSLKSEYPDSKIINESHNEFIAGIIARNGPH